MIAGAPRIVVIGAAGGVAQVVVKTLLRQAADLHLLLADLDVQALEATLAAYDLAGLDGREIVDQLDRTLVDDRHSDLMASVRAGELLLSDADSDEPTVVTLPADELYLSVAPYVTHTHDCFTTV